jgi:hypothetical protein
MPSLGVVLMLAAAMVGSHRFDWLHPRVETAGSALLVPSSGTSLLWYPRWLHQISGDPWSVTVVLRDRRGRDLVLMNAGPKTGSATMRTFPALRIDHLHEERERDLHEEAVTYNRSFRDGRKGSCVMDDYVTRLAPNHYREIACYVQGRTTASVIVAAVLVRDWSKYGPVVERAVDEWEVR